MRDGEEIEHILESDKDPLVKVRELVHMGMDEEQADYVVGQYQTGQNLPLYYEKLDFDDYL